MDPTIPAKDEGPTMPPDKFSLLAAEKSLIFAFLFLVGITILLMIIGTSWYYFTFVLSLAVLLVTYKEGLVAMEEE